MSGVWETLFREEKQDWTSCIVNAVTNTGNMMVEIPCAILAMISATVFFAFAFFMSQAMSIAEFLRLEEWWGIEHTAFSVMMTMNTFFVLRRGRGDRFNLMCQVNCLLMQFFTLGCFFWLAAGLQGGVVFGGKFFFPTLALLSMVLQMVRMTEYCIDKEVYGYGEKQEPKEGVAAKVHSFLGKVLCTEMSLFFCVATFGLPTLEGEDLLPWISVFPFIAQMQQTIGFFQPEAPAAAAVTDNGSVTKIQEGTTEESSVVADTPNEEAPKVEETKEEEAKGDDSKASVVEESENKDEEKKPDEPVKPAVLSRLCEAVCGLICEIGGKMTSFVSEVSEKICSMPWNYIISTTASVGTGIAVTYAYWTLTEDYLVLVTPVACHLVPFFAGKAKAKSWLSERGSHAALEISQLSAAAIQYYLFRTYIALPF